MAPGTSFEYKNPLSAVAADICKNKLTNGILKANGGNGSIVDSHHHVWSPADTPKAQSRFLNGDLEAWEKEGLDKLWYREHLAPNHPAKNNIPTKEETFKFFAGLNNSYGSVQVGLNRYVTKHLQYDIEEAGLKCDATVYLQAGWAEPDGTFLGETKWVQSQCDESGGWMARGLVGHVNMLNPDHESVKKQLLDHLAASKNFRGIRYMCSISKKPHLGLNNFAPKEDVYRDPVFLENMKIYSDLANSPEIKKPVSEGGRGGLTLDTWAYGWQIPQVTELAQKFPNVNIVLDHFGSPEDVANDPAELESWKKNIAELAKCPNVYAKISGLMPVLGLGYHKPPMGPLGDPGPTAEEMHKSVLGTLATETIKAFGSKRCMFGSNFPVDKPSGRFGELVACYYLAAKDAGCSDEDLVRIFRQTAIDFYRLSF